MIFQLSPNDFFKPLWFQHQSALISLVAARFWVQGRERVRNKMESRKLKYEIIYRIYMVVACQLSLNRFIISWLCVCQTSQNFISFTMSDIYLIPATLSLWLFLWPWFLNDLDLWHHMPLTLVVHLRSPSSRSSVSSSSSPEPSNSSSMSPLPIISWYSILYIRLENQSKCNIQLKIFG